MTTPTGWPDRAERVSLGGQTGRARRPGITRACQLVRPSCASATMRRVVVRSARLVPSALALALVVSPPALRAEEVGPASRIGDTSWALPGVVRVGVPGLGPRRVAAAGAVGYGLTEGQSSADGAHPPLMGGVAPAPAPPP